MAAPEIGKRVRATTTTATEQQVVVEVTAVEEETPTGWLVYGYRTRRAARPRQTMYPRLYFVPKVDPAAETPTPTTPTGPDGVCWEYQAGELPIRLSFTVKVF